MRLPTLVFLAALGLAAIAWGGCADKTAETTAEPPPEVRLEPVPDPSGTAAPPVPGADDPAGMVSKFADAMCGCQTTACTSEAYGLYLAYAARAPSPKSEEDRTDIASEAARLEACVDAMYEPLLASLTPHAEAACACADENCALGAQHAFGALITAEPKPPPSVQGKVSKMVQTMMACSAKLSQ